MPGARSTLPAGTGEKAPLRPPVVSLHTALLVLLVTEILAIVGLTSWLWYRNGQDAVANVESQLREEVTTRIVKRIESLLLATEQVNQLNYDLHRMGKLSLQDVEQLAPYLWHQIRTFPDVAYIDVGTERGDFIGLERLADGSYALELCAPGTEGGLFTWSLGPGGAREGLKKRPGYVVADRPWYARAVEAERPAWTEIYPFFSLPVRLGITAVRPMHDDDGRTVGVLGCDLVLTNMSRFLSQLRVGRTGHSFLIERTGLLVASSSKSPPIRGSGQEVERIHAKDLPEPLIQAAARSLMREFRSLDTIDESHQLSFDLDGETMLLQVAPVHAAGGLEWLAAVVVPESDFMSEIDANTRSTLLVFLALLALAGITMLLTTRTITRSIGDVSSRMNEIADFELREHSPHPSNFSEIRTMQQSMAGMELALRSFGKFVPTDVVRRLVRGRNEAVLGVKPAEVTILFADVEGFTSIAESLDPDRLVTMMSEYLDAMSGIIIDSQGTLDKYIGDAIMAFWNEPERLEHHARTAVRAALECQARLGPMNESWAARGLPRLRVRMGLHTGSVLVGNMGSHMRMNYTVIGDAVNLCSRIEGLNAQYGTNVLVSEAVRSDLGDEFMCRPLDVVAVKGKTNPTRIYEVMAFKEKATQAESRTAILHEEALEAYLRRDFAAALEILEEVLTLLPEDQAASVLRTRCREFIKSPPNAAWTGVHVLSQK